MSDEDKTVNRRSFLGRIAVGAALAGGALNLIVGGEALAITDYDPGDAAGRTGYTDNDPNDPAGNGRGRRLCGCRLVSGPAPLQCPRMGQRPW